MSEIWSKLSKQPFSVLEFKERKKIIFYIHAYVHGLLLKSYFSSKPLLKNLKNPKKMLVRVPAYLK